GLLLGGILLQLALANRFVRLLLVLDFFGVLRDCVRCSRGLRWRSRLLLGERRINTDHQGGQSEKNEKIKPSILSEHPARIVSFSQKPSRTGSADRARRSSIESGGPGKFFGNVNFCKRQNPRPVAMRATR